MSVSPEFRTHVLDLLSGLGPVTAKSMFGGAGLYLDGAMFALIALHVPIGIAMMAVGVLGYAALEGFRPALSSMINAISGNIENPGLAVIPLFLLMGSFATAGGLSAEIYRLATAFVGHRRGGLAMATMGGCGVFGAVCGSSTATAATFGRVALPEMLKRGYAPHFAAGTIAALSFPAFSLL